MALTASISLATRLQPSTSFPILNRVRAGTKYTAGLLGLLLCCLNVTATAQDFEQLSLVQVVSGLSQPVAVVDAGDGSGRLFIIEQGGRIRVYETGSGTLKATPFLDISSRVDSERNEQGLLGLAFHPDYAGNGYFYVNYTRDNSPAKDHTVIARFSVSAGNADIADDTSESKLMEIEQDAHNHNGGDLHFGQDGYLYIAMGDGGGSDDQYGHAQDTSSLKGKILRIDVDSEPGVQDVLCGQIQNYGIPADNPFVTKNGCDEVWSYGLRNPWRFSFDRDTGDMLIGDVGQRLWEEINHEPANTPGINYGWSCREGAHNFSGGNACVSAHIEPILEYSHSSGGCSVTGGYVYRGTVKAFQGYYFYGDYCSDQVWLAKNAGDDWLASEWTGAAGILASISSFGEDQNGELYIADRNAGKVYRILIEDGVVFTDSFETEPLVVSF